MSFDQEPEYSNLNYRPIIIDVQEDSLTTKWSRLPADIVGGSPITGFKLYLSTISGTFTATFRGYDTVDIATDATTDTVNASLV